MKKQLHKGAIQGGTIRDMLINEFQLDYESADMLIKKWLPNLISDQKYCANCGANMMEEIYTLDCLDAAFIFEMGKVVRERVRKNLPFTEANQVRVPTLATTDAIRHRTTKCAKLGLVAKVKGANGRQVQGYWLITSRGFAFLRGEPVPRMVAVWRRKIQERYESEVTIEQVFNTQIGAVKRSRHFNTKVENADVRNVVADYRREDWYELGKVHTGAII